MTETNVRSFIILQSREGLTSFDMNKKNKKNKQKKNNEAFRASFFSENTRKKL